MPTVHSIQCTSITSARSSSTESEVYVRKTKSHGSSCFRMKLLRASSTSPRVTPCVNCRRNSSVCRCTE